MSINPIEYRPPRIAMALMLIAGAVHVVLPSQLSHSFSSIYLPAVLASAGFIIMILAWWQFREHEVAICPTDATDNLITDGVYRFTRNPMYLGMVTMLLGVALFFGTIPFYAATIVYFLILDRWFCQYEEQKLSETFGRDYQHYKSHVRRWV